MMQSLIQGLDLYIKVSIKSSQYFLWRHSGSTGTTLRLGPSRSLRIPSSTGTGCGPSVPPGLPTWRPTCSRRQRPQCHRSAFSRWLGLCVQVSKAFTKRLFISCFKHVFFLPGKKHMISDANLEQTAQVQLGCDHGVKKVSLNMSFLSLNFQRLPPGIK